MVESRRTRQGHHLHRRRGGLHVVECELLTFLRISLSKSKASPMGTPASDKRKPIYDTNTGLWIDTEPHHIEALTAN